MGVAEAIIVSAVVGAASGMHQANQQKKAAAKTRDAGAKANEEAKAREKALRQNVNDTESATTTFGVDSSKKKKQTPTDLLVPKAAGTSVGGTTGRTGLGF